MPTWTRASRSLSRLKASFSALGSADHDADEELPFVVGTTAMLYSAT